MTDRTCLSTWFPKLHGIGVARLPVPKTEIIRCGDLLPILDGITPVGFGSLVDRIGLAADRLGYPVFLRTGQTSGKHRWKDTCYLTRREDIGQHVFNLVEFSALCDFIGLPTNVWAVREMLPVEPVAVLPMYRDMPLVSEIRCFVEGGKVLCHHGYWPPGAIAEGLASDYRDDQLLPDEGEHPAAEQAARLALAAWPTDLQLTAALSLAQRVADVFAGDGAWSVDLLATRNGWHITDMADAGRSFHWPGCENEKRWSS